MKIHSLLGSSLSIALSLTLLLGCGGSNSVSEADSLPVGSTLSVIMTPPSGLLENQPMVGGGLICYVQAECVGLMNYNSLELKEPNAFRYTRNGSQGTFETSFSVTSGSYIADGPVTVTEEGFIDITLYLDLGSEPERAFQNDYTGTCTYKQSFQPIGTSTLGRSIADGSGTFSLLRNGSSSNVSTTVTATSSSNS